MDNIKISVDVNVHLSEKTENFICNLVKDLVFNRTLAPGTKAAQASAAQASAAQASAAQASAAQASAAQASAAQASAAQASAASALTIDDVRKVVASKAAAHRDEVKAKLTELGAKNVTTLDPGKYQELVDYLNTLA